MNGTGAPRPRGRTGRWSTFFLAALVIPVGLYGVIGQRALGGWILVVVGLGFLAAWWVMRPRYAGTRDRWTGALCSLLTIAFTAAAELGLVLFLASPPTGVTAATLRHAIAAIAVAIVLLTARLLAGYWLRTQVAARAAAAVPAGRPGQAAAEFVPAIAGAAAAAVTMPAAAAVPLAADQMTGARAMTAAPGLVAAAAPAARAAEPGRRGAAHPPADRVAPVMSWLWEHQVLVGAVLALLVVVIVVGLVASVVALTVTGVTLLSVDARTTGRHAKVKWPIVDVFGDRSTTLFFRSARGLRA